LNLISLGNSKLTTSGSKLTTRREISTLSFREIQAEASDATTGTEIEERAVFDGDLRAAPALFDPRPS